MATNYPSARISVEALCNEKRGRMISILPKLRTYKYETVVNNPRLCRMKMTKSLHKQKIKTICDKKIDKVVWGNTPLPKIVYVSH